ncbi:MAG TPA: hypothetical protein VF058_03145 [Actinomycetota bacterium]
MPRYELPPDLSPEEERIVLAAIERMLELERPTLSPWVVAGRAEGLRIGGLHIRHQTADPWTSHAPLPFAPGGTQRLPGRGDAR